MPSRINKNSNNAPQHKLTQNQPSRLNSKHQIEHKTHFFDATMRKIAAIALIAFIIIAPMIGIGFYMMANPSHPTPVTSIPYTAIQPRYAEPVVPHEYFARGFIHPEHWNVNSNKRTTHSCKITPGFQEFETCNKHAETIYQIVEEKPSLKNEIDSPPYFYGDGYQVIIYGDTLNVGVNSQIRHNYEAALKIVEEKVLTDGFVESDILAIIQNVHKALVKNLKDNESNYEPILSGKYRIKPLVVQQEGVKSIKDLAELAVKRNGQAALPLFQTAIKKFSIKGEESLLPEERQILESVCYIPPNAKDIPEKMEKFIKKYRIKLKSRENPFTLAAWVHSNLVTIHPFQDANGRLARIFMNAELKRGGYLPVVILDNAAYSKAIKEDQKNPGTFVDYLAEIYPTSQKLVEITDFPDSA